MTITERVTTLELRVAQLLQEARDSAQAHADLLDVVQDLALQLGEVNRALERANTMNLELARLAGVGRLPDDHPVRKLCEEAFGVSFLLPGQKALTDL